MSRSSPNGCNIGLATINYSNDIVVLDFSGNRVSLECMIQLDVRTASKFPPLRKLTPSVSQHITKSRTSTPNQAHIPTSPSDPPPAAPPALSYSFSPEPDAYPRQPESAHTKPSSDLIPLLALRLS